MEILPKSNGIFYPSSEKELSKMFKKFARKIVNFNSHLIIVPHAGYEFSGKIAFNTYQYLDRDVSNIIVIAPAIYKKVSGFVSCDVETFATPLGSVKILPYNAEIRNDLFEIEPSFSVQLPFIKYFYPNASVIPILYGCENYNNITELISSNIENSAIIIASNLSRFIPEKESLKLDAETIRKIANLQIEDLDMELADGAIGICGAIEYAKSNGLKFVKTAHSNSAKFNEDTSNVVGYGGWYLTQ